MRYLISLIIIISAQMTYSQNGFHLVKKSSFSHDSTPENTTIYKYENERLTCVEYYSKRNTPDYIKTIEYNSKGAKIKETTIKRNGDLSSATTYRYSFRNRLKSETQYNSDNKIDFYIVFRYHLNGNKRKRKAYTNRLRLPFNYSVSKYSTSGKITSKTTYNIPFLIDSKLKYKYDKEGRLIYSNQVSGKKYKGGRSSSTYEYQYGNLIKRITCGGGYCDGMSYEYDRNNNLIKETRISVKYKMDETRIEIPGPYTVYEYKSFNP